MTTCILLPDIQEISECNGISKILPMQNLLKRMQINNAVLVKGVYMVPCIKLGLITEENIEIFLLNQDNVSLWMHTSTIAIPQEDISIVIFIRI